MGEKRNKRIGTRVLALGLSLVLALALLPWAAATEGKTVTVGYFALPGYHEADSTGARSGYGYELLQRLGRYENLNYSYVGYDKTWSEQEDMLRSGEIDLLTMADKSAHHENEFDFSERSVGAAAAVLTVKEGNTTIRGGEYATYDGIRIGLLLGRHYEERLVEFAGEKGFSYEAVYYRTVQELEAALQEGEVDALVTSSMRNAEQEWILERFAEEPIYAMVRKGDAETLALVNEALERMDRESPSWRTDLKEKYYQDHSQGTISLTASEQEYLDQMAAEGKVFRVLVNPDRFPYSYLKDGEIVGIMPDLFAEMAARAGIQYEYILTKDREEYGEKLLNAQTDLCLDLTPDFYMAERCGYNITDSYLTVPFSWIKQRDFSGEVELGAKLVYTWMTPAQYIFDSAHGEIDYITYDTREDCVEAVRSGEVDGYCTYTYQAEKLLFDNVRNDLTATLSSAEGEFTLGAVESLDSRLIAILNKAVHSMEEGVREEIIRRHTDLGEPPFSLTRMFYEQPGRFLLGSLAVFLVGLLVVHLMTQRRYQDKLQQTVQAQGHRLNELLQGITDSLAAAIEFRSDESGGHVRRIRTLTRSLLVKAGEKFPEYKLTTEEIDQIAMASVLHDLGKIAIPDSILNKPGPLTEEEFAVMKEHPVKGCEFFQQIPNLREESLYGYAYDICRWHHERWDGRGYPDGLKGENIPLSAQVVALADVYDALTMPRVYKEAYDKDTALDMILTGQCGQFNPKLLSILEEVSRDYVAPEAPEGDMLAPLSASKDTTGLFLQAFQILMANTDSIIFLKDADLIYRAASPGFAAMLGKDSVEEVIGRPDRDLIQDEDLWRHYNTDDRRLLESGRDLVDYLEPLVSQDGEARYATTSKYLLRDSSGRTVGIVGISRDITSEYFLKRHHEQELDYLFQLLPDAYFSVYIDVTAWRIVGENRQTVNGAEFRAHTTIQSLAENAHRNIADRRWPAYAFWRDFSQGSLARLYEEGKHTLVMEYRRIMADGSLRWVRDEFKFLTDPTNGHLCAMLTVKDIQEKKESEQRNIDQAERDDLTGLLNRRSFRRLFQEVTSVGEGGENHALFMIDADNFKQVNDIYGHQEGDRFLVRFADAIRETFRSTDLVGRIGGDEFVVLMRDVPNRDVVEAKAAILLEALSRTCEDRTKAKVSGSIGISFLPEDGRTLDQLYDLADQAMYRAKRQGKNQVVFYQDMI